jgi:CBS-domain-containing membrane protein
MTEKLEQLLHLIGLETRRLTWGERALATLGGFVSILVVLWVSRASLGEAALPIVASMGASAVLLFAVPHGPLSQPWPLLGGHLFSALVGVTCARLFGSDFVSAAAAVGLAIGVMHLLRCVHPPGGATALFAVLGGPAVQQLGYQFVLTPVLLNVAVILLVAVAFNSPFAWRRYPAKLALLASTQERPPAGTEDTGDADADKLIRHEDLVFALSEMDTFIDISEQDLLQIYEIATRHAGGGQGLGGDDIQVGGFYSNGRFGGDWQVREVLELKAVGDGEQKVVSFRIVAGQGRNQTGKTGLLAFLRWAGNRVERHENDWRRIDRGMG